MSEITGRVIFMLLFNSNHYIEDIVIGLNLKNLDHQKYYLNYNIIEER